VEPADPSSPETGPQQLEQWRWQIGVFHSWCSLFLFYVLQLLV